jgi:hypothetical protein
MHLDCREGQVTGVQRLLGEAGMHGCDDPRVVGELPQRRGQDGRLLTVAPADGQFQLL